MILKCPVCKDVTLTPHDLEPGLSAFTCGGCHGDWVPQAKYFAWLDMHGANPAPDQSVQTEAPPQPAKDSLPGKFCPECGRFLTRAKVGHGVEFHLDRCGGCGGIWCDAGEWAVLKFHGLHDDCHFIFSDKWQAEVARQTRESGRQQVLIEKLGPEALAEIKRIKAWLDAHPRRRELYAYLLDTK
jgi:Zn-finger nucleic acid-binding protein